MKDLDQAIHDTAKEYGIAKLAKTINAHEGTFYNQTNVKQTEHVMNIHTFRSMILASKDRQALESLAYDCGCIAVPLIDGFDMSDQALLEVVLECNEAHGAISDEIHKSLDDGVIELHEFIKIEERILQGVQKLLGMRDKFKFMVSED